MKFICPTCHKVEDVPCTPPFFLDCARCESIDGPGTGTLMVPYDEYNEPLSQNNSQVVANPKYPPEREAAFDAIDAERDYQAKRWGEHDNSVIEFLVYINDYTNEALHQLSRVSHAVSKPEALHTIRKIAALAVACMEQHGAKKR